MRVALLGIIVSAVGSLGVQVPVAAHHGASTFDTGKEITLKGVVTEWVWANPHCFLKFDARDETGAVRNWAVETQNPVSMTARGWSRNVFKVGDEVTVKLEPVKSGAPVGRVLTILLANGQTLVAAAPAP